MLMKLVLKYKWNISSIKCKIQEVIETNNEIIEMICKHVCEASLQFDGKNLEFVFLITVYPSSSSFSSSSSSSSYYYYYYFEILILNLIFTL
jgi:hypothetical protein